MLQHYLVVGLGITGYSVVEYLAKKNCNVAVTDSRINPPELTKLKNNFPALELFLGKLYVPAQITHIILSPGVPITTPEILHAQARGVEIIGDIELFAQTVDKPVIAITGSNGKSTTTSLLGAMAKSCGISAGVGGNLGTPALALLDPKHECYILELSSFQLETTHSLSCIAATVLNVSPDHMDRYTTLESYSAAKLRIYNHAQTAVVNRDDTGTVILGHASQVVSFGLDAPSAKNYGVRLLNGEQWLSRGDEILMRIADMAMMGQHNVANALAALALGEAAGFAQNAMLQTLRDFVGLEHRCEKVLVSQDVVWINDSKGTNVGATLAAIEGLGKSIRGKWIIILGGIGKCADFTPLIGSIAKYCKSAILIGTDAPILRDVLHDTVPCFMAKDMQMAVHLAREQTVSGDGVLLSPACASLDMFANYAQRGDVFKELVLQEMGYSEEYAQAKAI